MQLLEQKFYNNLKDLIGDAGHVALAVSGGSDSIALLILMYKYAKRFNVKITVMSVDHNLRVESKSEIAYVMQLSQKLGLTCAILEWCNDGNNAANLQERARNARYALMTNMCKKMDILTLLTAHHFNDNVENFVMRQKRKSGVFGLNNDCINFINNIRILRPLFNIHKQELVDYLLKNNITWFEDASNLSDKYLRNKVRIELASKTHTEVSAIVQNQIRVNNLANILKPLLIEAIATCVVIYEYGFAKINVQKLQGFAYEIQLSLLNFVMTMIGGSQNIPRFRSTSIILTLLNDNQDFVKTLHGCVLRKTLNTILIHREFGKQLPQNICLKNGKIWDNRFYLQNEDLSQEYYITSLSIQDYSYLKSTIDLQLYLKDLSLFSDNNHNIILFTLPIIKLSEKIIALPHISYYDEAAGLNKIKFSFQPSFVSRFTHFC